MPASKPRGIFVALDTTDIEAAARLAFAVKPYVGGLKIGMEYFLRHGHQGYKAIAQIGLPIFLDLKLHDIPNTVAGGVRALSPLSPTMITVHASGGPAMIARAREMAHEVSAREGGEPAQIIAVSVLTSLGEDDLDRIGWPRDSASQVLHLSEMAAGAGADGIVCSPKEVRAVREAVGDDLTLVVPGIRPLGDAADDQKRVMTPYDAVSAGADVLVVGRPITQAADPAYAAKAIASEIAL